MSTSHELGPRTTFVEVEGLDGDGLRRDSAASRVLSIMELVNIIFTFLSHSNNARNARVCKIWSEIALKIIWTEVVDLHALFSILAPLSADGPAGRYTVYSFVQLPSAARWRRFEKYATLVRTLVYAPTRVGKKHISRRVIRDVAQTRTRFDIFPNLHTLKWHSAKLDSDANLKNLPILTDSFIFMHDGIKSLEIYLHRQLLTAQMKEFLDDIPQRMPFLTVIKLHTIVDVTDLEDSILL